MAGRSDFGNGSGFLYIVNPDGVTINSSIINDQSGAKAVLLSALTASPSSGETLSSANILVNVGGGTVTTCTVNGVDVMGATAASGATPQLIATDLASKINSKLSVPDYTAVVIGSSLDTVQIKALPGTGSTPNGYVVVVGVSAPTTVTSSNMDGGTNGTGVFDPVFGQRFFINSDSSAVEGSLVSTTEITSNIAKRGFESQLYTQSIVISSGIIEPTRVGSISRVNIDTEGLAATDNLDSIAATNFQDGDILILSGISTVRVITVRNDTGSGGIFLTNSINYDTFRPQNQLALQYKTLVGGTNGWYELTRSATPLNVAALRAQGIPEPISGVNLTTLTAGGGTINIEAGVDKGTQVYDGSAVLVGSWVIQPTAVPTTPYLDGDEIWVDYRSTLTAGANTVTIFGITLTSTQSLEGRTLVRAKYKLSNTTWYASLIYKANGVDVTDRAYVDATFEPLLPASAGDTFVLQKTTLGVYSFVPNTANTVLTNTTANSSTTAVITEETLATYIVAANTMATDGDLIEVSAVFQTAANVNLKTMRIKFGATTVWTSVLGTFNNRTIVVTLTINRITSTTQSSLSYGNFGSATTFDGVGTSVVYSTPAETLSSAVNLLFTGENGIASAGDITLRHYSVRISKIA